MNSFLCRRFLVIVWLSLLASSVFFTTSELFSQSSAQGPAEILQLFGMDKSTLRQFVDGTELSSDEHEPLIRLLSLLPRFDRLDLSRWSRPVETGATIANDPAVARGEFFRLRGWVCGIEEIELPSESSRRFDFDRFYQLEVRLSSEERSVLVCCRNVPAAWRLPAARSVEIPMSCEAMFVKNGLGETGSEQLVFVTDHVAWHPFEPDAQLGVSAGQALLGQAGMDVSLFADLSQAKPIGHTDRDCFYEMLWAVGRLDPSAMRQVAQVGFDIGQLLQHPRQEAGEFYLLQGVARRAFRVQVDDPDIRERFGLDHYYEVDLFLTLPRTLKLVDPSDGEARYYQTYPVTCCVRQLPEGMPEGSEIRQEITVCASYLKLWSYKSRFAAGRAATKAGQKRRQVSPLFIARTVQPVRPTYQRTAWPEVALVIGFLFSMVVIGASGWYYARSDRAFVNWRHRRPDRLPDRFDDGFDDDAV
ncbi:MAG: hypothetical protein P8N76_14775 [Pirellulaceae bacterium]|nr:hypothetical protein [Pirellulaceae bacterium]